MYSSTRIALVPQELNQAFEACRRITHEHGPNFSVGFRFLPMEKRRAVWAAYAFCRYVDDIADEGTAKDSSLLDVWEEELDATYAGRPTHLITQALAHVLQTYPIPKEAFANLIEGCRWDFTRSRYETFDDLIAYCDLVAATISEISLGIFGALDEEAHLLGKALAYGLQLTNILRDVGEDLERGRIYLPQEDLVRFGVSEEDLAHHRVTNAFRDLMRFQIERTQAFFDSATPLPDHIETDARLAVRLMGGIYVAILRKVARSPEDVLSRETHLNLPEKLLFLFRTLLNQRPS